MKFAKVNPAALAALVKGHIEANDLAVLVFLGTAVNFKTGEGVTSNQRIEKATGLSRSTVIRSRRRLADAGLTEERERRGQAPIVKVVWGVTGETGVTDETGSVDDTRVTDETGVTGETGGGVTRETEGVSPVTPHINYRTESSQSSCREGDARAHTHVADPVPKSPTKPQPPPPTDRPRNQPTPHEVLTPLREFAAASPYSARATPWASRWIYLYVSEAAARAMIEDATARIEADPDGMTRALGQVYEKAARRQRTGPVYSAFSALEDWLQFHAGVLDESAPPQPEPSPPEKYIPAGPSGQLGYTKLTPEELAAFEKEMGECTA